jgi:hypothetical protein
MNFFLMRHLKNGAGYLIIMHKVKMLCIYIFLKTENCEGGGGVILEIGK